MIICTIHQPSVEIWESFSHVMALANGRTAYTGKRASVIPHFEQLGHPLPPNMNPAEHILHITNSEFTDPSRVQRLINAFEEESITFSIVESPKKSSADSQKKTKPHAGTQLLVLLR
eukprot:161201_1